MASEIEQRVLAIVVTVFQNKGETPPPLRRETPLDGCFGLESLDFAELIVRLEEEFGCDPFSEAEVPRVNTLGDLIALYE
jgi:acyl carrier protein